MLVALKKAGCFQVLVGSTLADSLLGAGVLGHSLGALRHGVLGQLTREQEPHSGLDLPGGDGGPLVIASAGANTFRNNYESTNVRFWGRGVWYGYLWTGSQNELGGWGRSPKMRGWTVAVQGSPRTGSCRTVPANKRA